ncbi:unnamed protein product [Prorocentrum cordatum]|uniref:Uncharacterized protein n=1 Tax=Prorocentrum cordatum TaxID=2364126 RepID=A0ABN9VMX4_9DINO|nr:unnamed protein product [Polarella glacialis]
MAASELRDAQRRTESELEESRTDTSELRNAQDRAEMELEASKTAASELREALVRAEAEMDSQRRAEAEHVESNAVPFDHPVFGQLGAARTELAEALARAHALGGLELANGWLLAESRAQRGVIARWRIERVS